MDRREFLAGAISLGLTGRSMSANFIQDWLRATVIWSGNYADMPYMIRLPSGDIFCCMTTSRFREGSDDTKIVGFRSSDDGETWQSLGTIMPTPQVQAWAVPWLDDEGTLYLISLFNQSRTYRIPYGGGQWWRADICGLLRVGRSTDNGSTWEVLGWASWPSTSIDLRNPFSGAKKLFWLCGMPRVVGQDVFIPISKVGTGRRLAVLDDTESFLVKAPAKITANFGTDAIWSTIPASGNGIRAQPLTGVLASAGVRPQEEPSIVVLDNGVIYGVFRTTLGRVGEFSVNTNGSSLVIGWARQANGDTIYHPRAKAELFDFGQGRYLLWHHSMFGGGWDSRTRADVRVGTRDGNRLVWSQPIGLAFDARRDGAMSYPSAILSVDGTEIIFAATDKESARCWRAPLADFF